MHPAIAKLLSVSGNAIASPVGLDECMQYLGRYGGLGNELGELLSVRNGFYAFESALLIRPLGHHGKPSGVMEWNDPASWKGEFIDDLADVLFFGEDVFGGQFCVRGGEICTFDPETGVFEASGSSLGEWANVLMGDYEYRTGYPLAHTWQIENAPLRQGVRLLPKIPFVCGGKYEIKNLYTVDDLGGMRFRASIANQIRNLPDGAQIVFDVQNRQATTRRA